MKDFAKTLGSVIITVIISVVATIAVIQVTGDRFLPKTFDSSVAVQVDDNSQVLKSLTDVLQLRQEMMDERRIDSTFLSINDNSLSNVVAVLLKRDGFTNKDNIVNEYLAGRSVYDNLPPPSDGAKPNATTTQESDPIANVQLTKEGSTTVTEGPPTRVVNESQITDTIINGKRYKPVN